MSEDNWQEHNQRTAGLPFTNHGSICSIVPVTGYKLGYGNTGPKLPICCPAPLPAPWHRGSFLQRSLESRSYWSQHKLALLAHWWWAGNWIIRHTFPLMGFFPPCLCRSFGRIKASMYHRYVKEKRGVKMECSWVIQEKKLFRILQIIKGRGCQWLKLRGESSSVPLNNRRAEQWRNLGNCAACKDLLIKRPKGCMNSHT